MKIKSMSKATSITIIAIAVMTLWSELSEGFKTFLKGLTGHHWTAKGLISLILFIALYFIIPDDKKTDVTKESILLLWITIISFLAIFLFYVFHFFGAF